MQKDQLENLLALVSIVTRHNPKLYPVVIARNLAKLQRLSVTLRKRYEATCSYPWANEEKYLNQTEKYERKAQELGQEIGLVIDHQQDPRGCALWFTLDDREHVIF